eukprot:scaffold71753_cov60-Phaeocystis_antarctica.AAC.1
MPPMEAGFWSERSVSGISTLAATAVGRTVGHALGWIACVATSLNAAFVNGRPARPINGDRDGVRKRTVCALTSRPRQLTLAAPRIPPAPPSRPSRAAPWR